MVIVTTRELEHWSYVILHVVIAEFLQLPVKNLFVAWATDCQYQLLSGHRVEG